MQHKEKNERKRATTNTITNRENKKNIQLLAGTCTVAMKFAALLRIACGKRRGKRKGRKERRRKVELSGGRTVRG